MIIEIKGDITTAKSGLILQCVNCKGVMGSGVALAIKTKWPVVEKKYHEFCEKPPGLMVSREMDLLGRVNAVTIKYGYVGDTGLQVLNCFGQLTYGRSGAKHLKYDALDTCLKWILHSYGGGVIPVHFPLIGCGLAGGHWPVVREIIEHRLPDDLFLKHLWTL